MEKEIKLPLATAFLCAVLLALLALVAYGSDFGRHLDDDLARRLFAHRHGNAGSWGESIAPFADPLPLIAMLAAACGVALARGRSSLALAAVLAVGGANLTTQALKFAFAHPRAQQLLGGGADIGDVAFPSGHATAAASIAVAFALVVPSRLRPLTGLLGGGFALAVGVSVVVIGWHLPSDVLGGYLVAAGWGFLALAMLAALRARALARRAGQAPSSPAIFVK